MRFDHRVIRPFADAMAKLPGANRVDITAKGPNGNQPAVAVSTLTDSDAAFLDELVEDRIGIFQVDINPTMTGGFDPRANAEKLEQAKAAIGGLDGVTRVSSDEHRLVVGTDGRQRSKFLSQLLEDNIFGKDVYFQQ